MFDAGIDPEVVVVQIDPLTNKVTDMVLSQHIVRIERDSGSLVLHLADGHNVRIKEDNYTCGPFSAVIKM